MIGWLTVTVEDVPAGDAWLTPGEATVQAGLRLPRRRADWRLGRFAVHRALAAAGLDTAAAEVRAAADGAPELWSGCRRLPVAVSISHRRGLGACLLAAPALPVGCDLEVVEPRPAVFAADWFTPSERALCRRLPAGEQELAATLVWSAKESLLKVLRCGLRRDTRSVEVTDLALGADAGWRPLRLRDLEAGASFAGWWRRVPAGVLTVVAGALERPPVPLRPVGRDACGAAGS